jgi:ABC-type antimicrobial peptide transport system permease subunit
MALGAERTDVICMILRDSMGMVGLGILTGLPAAYGVARFLEASLFELKPIDPLSATSALVVLLLVSIAAAWLPARRAVSVNPVTALREE